jgi:hypothetical protein
MIVVEQTCLIWHISYHCDAFIWNAGSMRTLRTHAIVPQGKADIC